MSSPLCSSSVAMRLQSQKGVCLTESCVWRLWMPTAPRSTARFASMTSSLPMCPSLLTTMVRYVLSCSSELKGVGLSDLLIFCLSLATEIQYPHQSPYYSPVMLSALSALCRTTKFNIQFSIQLLSSGCPQYMKNTHTPDTAEILMSA